MDMLDALRQGYSSEMAFQITQIEGLSSSVTGNDLSNMRDYPIQGHTCAEISAYMHNSLRYEISGLLAMPLVGGTDIDTLIGLMGSASQRFGDRCGSAVEEAFYAGTQMAIRGIAVALGTK